MNEFNNDLKDVLIYGYIFLVMILCTSSSFLFVAAGITALMYIGNDVKKDLKEFEEEFNNLNN